MPMVLPFSKERALMKLGDYIALDCRADGSKLLLQKALSKTSWLEKLSEMPSDITLEMMESLYRKVKKTYPVTIGYIQESNTDSMICMVKNSETHEWIETIYFQSFFEMMAKVILVLYGYCKLGLKFKEGK